MRRRRFAAIAIAIALVAIVGVRLAVTPTTVTGYRVLDDFNVALRIVGTRAVWRGITTQEGSNTVAIAASELSLPLPVGAGFDDKASYIVVALAHPLGDRMLVLAGSGAPIPLLSP